MILAPDNCQCPLVDEGVSIVDSAVCPGVVTFMVLLQAFLKGRCDIADPCARIESPEKLLPEYDFIVVGGGSAGSIVAGRLSENNAYNVLLIEAGGREPIGAKVPSFYTTFWWNEEIDWQYRTVPADYCLDQQGQGCLWPRGKVLGGTSVLNGMMYHRGHAADYDSWVAAGATGWSWKENLPYFYKTEGNKEIGTLVSAEHHSASGPLPVQRYNYQPDAVYTLLQAINETGLPIVDDMNNPNTPAGFTIAQAFNADGQRYTTARAYVKPKPNLDVQLNSHVSKVLFEGKRAVGVEFIDENGETRTVKALKEVILSAGALNSPQILMHSGIGPKDVLQSLDIPVLVDLPVGKNLLNHYGMTFYFYLRELKNTRELDWSVLTEYLLERTGPMSSTGVTQLTGLLYTTLADVERQQPDVQFFFNGFYADCSRTGQIDEVQNTNGRGMNVSANVAILLPRSSGYVTINSTNPFDHPVMVPGYFTHPDDSVMIRDGARYLQSIFETDTMRKYGIELDNSTTERCTKFKEWSDEWIDCLARVNTDAQNHQLGTAAIGAVVDPELSVYHVEGLRVVDASVMPTQPTGNPQGAIMMVAERAAHFIQETWS